MADRKKTKATSCEISLRQFLGIPSPPANAPPEPSQMFWQAWAGSTLKDLLSHLKGFLKSQGLSTAVETSTESGKSIIEVSPAAASDEYADRFPKVLVIVWTMNEYFKDLSWIGPPESLRGNRLEIIQVAKRYFDRTVVVISGTSQLWQVDERFDEEAETNRRVFQHYGCLVFDGMPAMIQVELYDGWHIHADSHGANKDVMGNYMSKCVTMAVGSMPVNSTNESFTVAGFEEYKAYDDEIVVEKDECGGEIWWNLG